MDSTETVISILSLLLLCVTGVFGIPSNAFLLYKAIKNPTVLVRNIHYFALTVVGLIACGLLVPLLVTQRVWASHKGSANVQLCTPILSISGFVDFSLLFTVSVLTLTRSRQVQTLRRRTPRYERPFTAVGLLLGFTAFIYIWSTAYDSKTWNAASNTCTFGPDSLVAVHISGFFIIRLIMFICACMVMLGSWISMLKFLYFPRVVPVQQYTAGLPQISVIFDKSFISDSDDNFDDQPTIIEAITNDDRESVHIDDNPRYSMNTPSLITRAMSTLPNFRRASSVAFSDICPPRPRPSLEVQIDRSTPLSLPCDLSRNRTYSMLSAKSGPWQWKIKKRYNLAAAAADAENDGCSSAQSFAMMRKNSDCSGSVVTDYILSAQLSSNNTTDPSVDQNLRVAEYLINEHDECLPLPRCQSMYSASVGPSKWKRCNRKMSLEVKKLDNNPERRDSCSSSRSIFQRGSLPGSNLYPHEETILSHSISSNSLNVETKGSKEDRRESLEQENLKPPVNLLVPGCNITSQASDKNALRPTPINMPVLTLTQPADDHVELCVGDNSSIVNSQRIQPDLARRLTMPGIASPGYSTGSEFSFKERRRLKSKKATLKPFIEIILLLVLMLPDFVLKSLIVMNNQASGLTLVPLTESVELVIFAVVPVLYVITNKTIMETL